MNESIVSLPANALTAFTARYPEHKPGRQGRHRALRLADCDHQTVALDLLEGRVVLRLSQDCPFDEIAPGYLAIFVRHLAELCPYVPVAFIPGYGHLIVATLPLEVDADASSDVWASAIEATIPRLEEALSRQGAAAHRFSQDESARGESHLPDIVVTPEDLAEIGRLGAGPALEAETFDRDELDRSVAELIPKLRSLKVIRPEQNWVRHFRSRELHAGFFDAVFVEQFTAGQVVVALNAIYQGNLYNTVLLRRACDCRLIARLAARALELRDSKGSDRF